MMGQPEIEHMAAPYTRSDMGWLYGFVIWRPGPTRLWVPLRLFAARSIPVGSRFTDTVDFSEILTDSAKWIVWAKPIER